MKRHYKLVVREGHLLPDALTKIEQDIAALYEEGWYEEWELRVQQCGSRYICYKEMTRTEYDDPEEGKTHEFWHSTVTELPVSKVAVKDNNKVEPQDVKWLMAEAA